MAGMQMRGSTGTEPDLWQPETTTPGKVPGVGNMVGRQGFEPWTY